MANGLDADGQARGALRQVLAEAPDALGNATQLSNMLKDFMPDSPREAGVLVTAVEAGAADLLRDKAAQVGGQAAAVQVAGMLEERTGLSQAACQWAVTELAVATGVMQGGPAQPAGTAPPQPPAPTQTAGAWGQLAAAAPGQSGQPAAGQGQFGQQAAAPGRFGQPQAGGYQQQSAPAQQGSSSQPQPGQFGQPQPGAFGQPAGQGQYGQPQQAAYAPPTTTPGAYGQATTGQPQGLYGQGVTSPGAYGQQATPWAGQVAGQRAAGRATAVTESAGLALTAGICGILAALFVAWYALAQPGSADLGFSLLYAAEGIALIVAALLTLISGTARRLGAGLMFGASAISGSYVINASFTVHYIGETSVKASSILLALAALAAFVTAGIYLIRAAGMGGVSGIGVGWLIAAFVYAICWIPAWNLFPGETSSTIFSDTTSTEKLAAVVGLVITILPLVLCALLKPRSGPFRAAVAVGWLALTAAGQFISLPGLEFTGDHVTGWLWVAWLVWFGVICLIVATAIQERSATPAQAQQTPA
jgi:hypothetical protein